MARRRSLTGTPVNKSDRQMATVFAKELERARLAVKAREDAKVNARREAREKAKAATG